MDFDNSSPIWSQLLAEFSRRIVVGHWQPGTRLPGVRDLAAELGVNPNTVQRSLSELERAGLCRTERTVGRFVTGDGDRIDEERRNLARGAGDDFVRRVRGLALSRDEAQSLVATRWEETDTGTGTETDTETEEQ
ncbi:GntR family transcriptional regulator [Corynebacterium sp. USCH3]|uniref:GntR family transcriptional regulator n=1 Tax=Corynebacterium sp. USCH3 TaxID=3024840 RepID=UPI0030A683BF